MPPVQVTTSSGKKASKMTVSPWQVRNYSIAGTLMGNSVLEQAGWHVIGG
jgi:hypothetical protein